MKRTFRYLFVWTPTALFLAWWKVSNYFYHYLGCQGGKGSPKPCVWEGIDVQGWFSGSFFGYILFWVSVPIAAYICFEMWLRHYKAALDADAGNSL